MLIAAVILAMVIQIAQTGAIVYLLARHRRESRQVDQMVNGTLAVVSMVSGLKMQDAIIEGLQELIRSGRINQMYQGKGYDGIPQRSGVITP